LIISTRRFRQFNLNCLRLFEGIISLYFSTYISVFGAREISEISLKQPEIMGMTKASLFSKMSVLTKDFMIDFMVALELERSL